MSVVPTFTVKTAGVGEWTCATCGKDLGALMAWDGPQVFIPESCPTQGACMALTIQLFASMFTPKIKGIC